MVYIKMDVPEPLKVLRIIGEFKEIKGKINIHKIVYSYQVNKGINLGYKFVNYSFGPYSKELEEDIKLLITLGLVSESRKGDGTRIRITEEGIKVLQSLKSTKLQAFRLSV